MLFGGTHGCCEAKSKDAKICLILPWWASGLVFCLLIRSFRPLELQEGGRKQQLSILSIDSDVFLSHELAEAILAHISSWGKITTFVCVGFFFGLFVCLFLALGPWWVWIRRVLPMPGNNAGFCLLGFWPKMCSSSKFARAVEWWSGADLRMYFNCCRCYKVKNTILTQCLLSGGSRLWFHIETIGEKNAV